MPVRCAVCRHQLVGIVGGLFFIYFSFLHPNFLFACEMEVRGKRGYHTACGVRRALCVQTRRGRRWSGGGGSLPHWVIVVKVTVNRTFCCCYFLYIFLRGICGVMSWICHFLYCYALTLPPLPHKHVQPKRASREDPDEEQQSRQHPTWAFRSNLSLPSTSSLAPLEMHQQPGAARRPSAPHASGVPYATSPSSRAALPQQQQQQHHHQLNPYRGDPVTPHRYDVHGGNSGGSQSSQPRTPLYSGCYQTTTDSGQGRSGSTPYGISGSRSAAASSSHHSRHLGGGGATPTFSHHQAPPENFSPTQLRFTTDDGGRFHADFPPSPAVGQQYSSPPPFQRVPSLSRPPMHDASPSRAANVFDHDQLAAEWNQRAAHAGGLASSNNNSPLYATQRAWSAVMPQSSNRQTHFQGPTRSSGGGGGVALAPLATLHPHAYFAAPLLGTQASSGAVPQRTSSALTPHSHRGGYVSPRIHFYDRCEAIVEERDQCSGAVCGAFRCMSLLGTGGFAKVFDFVDCRTGERFACKVIDKAKLNEGSKRAKLAAEIDVHRRMQHQNILRFLRNFQDDYYHYILLERCCRQSLMDLSKVKGTFSVEEVQFIMLQLLQGVEHMHQHRVIHRDLKLGNIMLDGSGNMKIGDFGFAVELKSADERKRTMCGTPNYIAPEILTANETGGYSFEADVWSLGVILYTLVVGVPPFETTNLQSTYSRIKRCEYGFPPGIRVSESCKDLITWMLQRDPNLRPQLVQIRSHPFLRFPEPPRSAPPSLTGLDPDLASSRHAPSPYAEAGRSSSPINLSSETATTSPLVHPASMPVLRVPSSSAVAAQSQASPTAQQQEMPVAFTPPPAYGGPQPTPYHFSATPSPGGCTIDRQQHAQQQHHHQQQQVRHQQPCPALTPPPSLGPAIGSRTPASSTQLQPPSSSLHHPTHQRHSAGAYAPVARPLYVDAAEDHGHQQQRSNEAANRHKGAVIASMLRDEAKRASVAAAKAAQATIQLSANSLSTQTSTNASSSSSSCCAGDENAEGKLSSPSSGAQLRDTSASSSDSSSDAIDRATLVPPLLPDENEGHCGAQVLSAPPLTCESVAAAAPPPPRVFFTDMVHFPRYGYGFQTWDQRGGGSAPQQFRTKSTGAYLNDKSKLVRDIKNDVVWYFARVRDETPLASAPTAATTTTISSPLLGDDVAPRCFYDQLHQFVGGSSSLDPKSAYCETLSPFLQSQHVFKKYTIVKFMETHFSNHSSGIVWHDDCPTLHSAWKNFSLEPHEDIFSRDEVLPASGDACGDITFVKEAAVVPVMSLLPGNHSAVSELCRLPTYRQPVVAAARFSDVSFQVSIQAPCPCPLSLIPQIVGMKGATAVSSWRLDVVLYNNYHLAIVYRVDDDVFALSLANVALQKKRGFGGAVVYSATSGYPRLLSAILVPEATINVVLTVLRRIHCPEDLIASVAVNSDPGA